MTQWNNPSDESDMTDRELPDPSDMDSDDADAFPDTEPCPYCQRLIYEDAEFCPRCGKYISREDTSPRTSAWLLIGGLVCLILIVVVWVL